MPALIKSVEKYSDYDNSDLQEKIDKFNNNVNLDTAIHDIIKRFE